MSRTWTIAQRELLSLFFSPIAYVVLGLFGFGATLIFFGNFAPGQEASLRGTLSYVVGLSIFLVPALSMRLLSEEFRSGTIESLMTAPISDAQLVLGKWLGTTLYFAILLLGPMIVLITVLEWHAAPEYGPIFTGLLGMLLVGAMYLAIGVFTSAVSQNQIIAFILSVFIISLLTFAMMYMAGAQFLSIELRQVCSYLCVFVQFQDFNKGVIDLTNIVYFLSGTALFLFLAIRLVESRRWR